MKKAISLVLAVIMLLSLCACGKSDAVKAVEEAIGGLGEITMGSEAAIKAVEEQYNALSDGDKKKVENYGSFEEAQKKYVELVAENEKQQKAFLDSEEYVIISGLAEYTLGEGMVDIRYNWSENTLWCFCYLPDNYKKEMTSRDKDAVIKIWNELITQCQKLTLGAQQAVKDSSYKGLNFNVALMEGETGGKYDQSKSMLLLENGMISYNFVDDVKDWGM